MNTITHWLLTAALVLLAAGAQTATSDGEGARIRTIAEEACICGPQERTLKGQWQMPALERAD